MPDRFEGLYKTVAMRTFFLTILGAVIVLSACSGVVSTRKLADAFNGGVLEGASDPFYSRSQRASDTLAWGMREELGEAYFGEGAEDARAVGWLRHLGAHSADFMNAAIEPTASDNAETSDASAGVDALATYATPGSSTPKEVPQAQQKMRVALSRAMTDSAENPSPGTEALCDAEGHRNDRAVERFADYVRFTVSLQRATANAASLLRERFVTLDEAIKGGKRAFDDTAAYLAHRKWRRDLDHPVTGLVVKGGAATGIFSAGVVYVALNLVNECIAAGRCSSDQAGFAMASGTSTGATVATAADVFHTAIPKGSGKRLEALDAYRNWYLCSSMNDLYCVRNRVAFALARSHAGQGVDVADSFLDFNGLAGKAEGAYGCDEMNNRMELILNTVDFRTGRLYGLSDQDPATLRAPWDIAKAVVSSAALPFIVRPTYNLPVDPVDAGTFAYLDGGIRSELPLLALVRRGVERMLVVSSGASVTGDHIPIGNALTMAIRYIDISTGGVTEAEIEHASAAAQAMRLAEYESCQVTLDEKKPSLCTPPCNADRLCAGDFANVCKPTSRRLSNDSIVATTFGSTNVWRNEDRIPGLPGYSFNPDGQRKLMLAGIEAAREQCRSIASTLGVPKDVGDAQLFTWCSPRLPTNLEQCGQAKLDRLAKSPDAADCRDDNGPTPADAGSTNACRATEH